MKKILFYVPFLFACSCSTSFSPPVQQVYYKNYCPKQESIAPSEDDLTKFIASIVVALKPSVEDPINFAETVVTLSKSEGVDPLFITAIMASESRFSATAKSRVGARGLMQIMPKTAKYLAKKHNMAAAPKNITAPETNITLGIRYIKELDERYNGDRFLILAAYNWGPGKVDRYQEKRSRMPKSVKKYSTTIITNTESWNKHFSLLQEAKL